MDSLTFSKIKEAIDRYNNIAVAVSNNPSVDQMASALALSLSLQNLGKNVTVASPTTPLVEVSNLVGIDTVRTSIGGETGDLIVSFPYREGEIEKVSYTRNANYLNIVVKAGELGLNFDEKDVKFTRGGTAPELLFVIGSPRVSDLGPLFDVANLKDTVVVNIDNSAENQGFGDILMVSGRLSSLSETIANLLLGLNYKIDLDVAQNLMAGIADATNNFQSPNTSALAFEMAGILMRNGAVRPGAQMVQIPPRRDDFIKAQEQLVKTQEIEKKEGPKIQQNNIRQADDTLNNPPEDWLEPKIYKGSTNF